MRPHRAVPFVLFCFASCGGVTEPQIPIAGSLLSSIGLARSATDPNQGGRASEIRVAEVSWGRLADVYALDPDGGEPVLVAEDLVVGPDIVSDDRDFRVDTDPITAIASVTILHSIGSSEFDAARARLEAGLVPVAEKSLDPGELPPFPMVPRDAAIVVRFDDLIDPASVSASSVQIRVGTPPVETFPARVLVDANHPTRVILDTTVSEAEALQSSNSIAVHTSGLPPSRNPGLANVALVLPAGSAVRNLAGNGRRGDEVVRAMRSGNGDDAGLGLLADLVPPRVVGVQGLTVDAVAPDPQGGPQDFEVNLTIAALACARAARPRDVLVTLTSMAVVTRASAAPVAGQLVRVRVRLVAGPPLASGPGFLHSVYRPVDDAGHEACFLRFTPPPSAPPQAWVQPDSQIAVRFSEPMDPATVSGLESFTVSMVAAPASPREQVCGSALPNVALDDFRFVPQVPLDHAAGTSETYFVNLGSGAEGPTDLAGNPLRDALPQVPFHLDPAASVRRTGSYVLRFESVDEDGDGKPEIRGQFLRDLARGAILPRSVSRFSAVADRTQAVPALMHAVPGGVQTPLSPFGSRLHALWRYCDVGLGLLDESFTNVDVEGLAWSPVGGSVLADQYPTFEMSFAHAGFQPDEVVDPTSLLPAYPNSGVVATFAENQLDPAADPLRVVHPRQRGYTVNPADLFVATTGTPMMPWPLNRNLPADQFSYYTWRDTSLLARKAPNGAGAELAIVVEATGSGTAGVPYPAGQVPTIGLPLLMEFKCFPEASAIGLNALDANLAINSSPGPCFRAFSTGGTNSSGITVLVDPDLQTVAQGGFNPSSNPPGLSTLPIENTFYLGQMDLVVRVSRVHSVWIDSRLANTIYVPPVVEPFAGVQPPGTQVQLAFRGAVAAIASVQRDASSLDAYGDSSVPGAVGYFHGDPGWKSSIAQLNGARLVQVRASFVSNAATGLEPEMKALGLAFAEP
jgi:hypothetical protein